MVEVGAGAVRPAAVEASWASAKEGASMGVGGGGGRSRRLVAMGPTDVELRWDPILPAAAGWPTGFRLFV